LPNVAARGWNETIHADGLFHFGYIESPLGSREVIQVLRANGWRLDWVTGDHHQYRHPSRPGAVTVPHPKKDLSKFVLHSIEKQAGLKLR